MRGYYYDRYKEAVTKRNGILIGMLEGFLIGVALSAIVLLISGQKLEGDLMTFVIGFGAFTSVVPPIWKYIPGSGIYGILGYILLLVRYVLAIGIGMFVTPVCLIFRTVQSITFWFKWKFHERQKSTAGYYNYTV